MRHPSQIYRHTNYSCIADRILRHNSCSPYPLAPSRAQLHCPSRYQLVQGGRLQMHSMSSPGLSLIVTTFLTECSFLGMISTATAGGTVTSYSSRFTLTGMTGVFSAAVTTALATVSGTTGPAVVNAVAAAAGTTGAADEGVYGTPYNEQTGLTRYAPMQPVPPTAITATNTSPLWPTSSVVLVSTFLPIPSIVTTITQANTFSVSSHANTVCFPGCWNVWVEY